MPDSGDDIETRVGVLEREVVRLREQVALTGSDANAARALAAGADHDVSEVRAGLDQKVTEGFAMLGTGMPQITALLSGNASSGQG